jgi:Ca2+-binding RTX toxin-like protein
MTQFVFDQLPTNMGPLMIDGMDSILFHGGSANAASVTFGFGPMGVFETTISFEGHTVSFDPGVFDAAANHHLMFDDGSLLLIGGPQANALDGGMGGDAMFGGGGDDTLNGHDGANVLQGNQGNDVLTTGSGADMIFGGQGDDLITTGTGMMGESGDFAQGNLGDDTLIGGAGPDILMGGQGDDSIQGGAGWDWLSGDLGNDTLVGGAGADVFFGFHNGGDDKVLDFNGAEGDLRAHRSGRPLRGPSVRDGQHHPDRPRDEHDHAGRRADVLVAAGLDRQRLEDADRRRRAI